MELFITGAGVSRESGIPTFRGVDGFWTIGSKNYTPQEMATRRMYKHNPAQFLLWYFKRFIKYRNVQPNKVHYYLSNKNLITQNIDGLDYKAGNKSYVSIHGNLHKVTRYHTQGENVDILDAPWNEVENLCPDHENTIRLENVLLDCFKISNKTRKPEKNKSFKPHVLLFDEYYTDIYGIKKAEKFMSLARKFVFLGTSFSVNITSMALTKALENNAEIEIVDPKPISMNLKNIKYFKMSALEFIKKQM